MNDGIELTKQPTDDQAGALEQKPVVLEQPEPLASNVARRQYSWRRITGISLVVLGMAGAGIFSLTAANAEKRANQTSGFGVKSQTFTLTDITNQLTPKSTQPTNTLTVNGQVVVGDSLVIESTAKPTKPVAGQIFYDNANNTLTFFNGTDYIGLLGGNVINTQVTNAPITNNFSTTTLTTTQVNQITNVTNNTGLGGDILGTGTAGTLALFSDTKELSDSMITQSGANLTIGNNAAVQNVTAGSGFGASTSTLQGGSGGVVVSTGATAGVSGGITIQSGNSSTTASGNISIDTGSSIINGTIVESKTFEGGVDDMQPWFGSTVATSAAQARTGTNSLAATLTGAFWGVIEILPGTAVIPGHQYYFSVWVRADTASRTILPSVAYVGSATTVNFNPVADNNTGWTEITGLAAAPAGATSVYLRMQNSSGVAGEIHYFDDITVTDLSSASAISALELGMTNAKLVTIGNMNQIGATSIYGGSGISLASGAAGVTVSGGVLSLTGNAASTFSTTAGALTLTSAEATTWGVGTSAAGNGGDLTLRAGNGEVSGATNGGNLILQGGNRNGAGVGGGVIVRPQADSASAFVIQDSASTPLFVADTSTLTLSVTGTNTVFATLALTDSHFRSTQTTAPTIGTPANCGTSPTAVVTAASTDVAGSFTITTGTGGTSSTCDTIITFHRTYGAAPKSIVVVGKTDAASVARQIYVSAATATTFTASFATSAGGADSTAYDYSYWVVE